MSLLDWSDYFLWASIALCALTIPFSIWTVRTALQCAKRPPTND